MKIPPLFCSHFLNRIATRISRQTGCVDRYKFHIPIRISDETIEEVSELKAIAQLRDQSSAGYLNANQTIGQKLRADLLEGELRAKQASQYKWFPAEVVDLLLGDVNEVKNPYIGQSRGNGYQRGYQRKTTVRKLSRKFSLVKRNKTFKTPMSKYGSGFNRNHAKIMQKTCFKITIWRKTWKTFINIFG